MSTQPISPETTTALPPISGQLLTKDRKGEKGTKLRKRTASLAKKIQAKSKPAFRKPRVTQMSSEVTSAAELIAAEAETASAAIPEPILTPPAETLLDSHSESSTAATEDITPACELQVINVQLPSYVLPTISDLEQEFSVIDDIPSPTANAATVEEKIIPPQPVSAIKQQPWLALLFKSVGTALMEAWQWLRHKASSHQEKKRLRVCESVSLGEKRFVAVIQVDGQQFLVGGSSTSISTLAQLEPARDFAGVLQRTREEDLCQA